MPTPAAGEVLTVEQAAVRHGVSVRSLYNLRAKGKLRTFARPGSRRVFIAVEELDAAFAPVEVAGPGGAESA